MRDYRVLHDVVDAAGLARLRAGIAGSGRVGESQLAGTFSASRGFGVAFTRAQLDEVRARFSFLARFVDVALSAPVASALRHPLSRRAPAPNAFYANVLRLEDGGAVGPHVDATLGGPVAPPETTPAFVSALYVDVPDDLAGGELVLGTAAWPLACLAPRAGDVVVFRGTLTHGVREVRTAGGGARTSLVCEQYVLDDESLARLPAPRVQSRAMDPVFAPGREGARDFGALVRQKRR